MKPITAEELRDMYVAIEKWEAAHGKLPGRLFYDDFASRINDRMRPEATRSGYWVGICSGCTQVKELMCETNWCDDCLAHDAVDAAMDGFIAETEQMRKDGKL